MEIPAERLPPGFAASVEQPLPGEPVIAHPAATVVLLRDGTDGLELFLMRRNRSSGFVPGAWVFPGGRVDDADTDPTLVDRARDLPAFPDAPFWMAAARETFEETGVLLVHGSAAPDAAPWRNALLEDRATLAAVYDAMGGGPDFRHMVHIAHWITPVVEPRRFDTHFFATVISPAERATPDPREMSDAIWITPDAALDRFRAGTLPMVFPTVRTIESLRGHATASKILDAFRGTPVRTILPRLVRTASGIGIVVDEES